MTIYRPKYISFDCYGTLTNFRMAEMACEIFPDRVPADRMEAFVKDFAGYRLDEVLGAWKPYREVVHNSIERTCRRWGIEFRPEEALRVYQSVPTWGPHPDVPNGLARIADKIPLVILSNAMNEQIHDNVRLLGARFHGRAGASLQAEVASVRIYVRPAWLRSEGHHARLIELPLRSAASNRSRHRRTSVRRARARALQPLLP